MDLHHVPSNLVQLSQLQMLCLADNGSLGVRKDHQEWWPEELTMLTSFTSLDLSSCSISCMPVALASLSNLGHLDIGANSAFPGIMLPLALGGCSCIHSLRMDSCNLSVLPTCLCMWTRMESLILVNNQLPVLPTEFTRIANLRDLDLASNNFLEFPTLLVALTNLARVDFKGCAELQVPLHMLSSLSNLTLLDLTCDLSRSGPRWSAVSVLHLVNLVLDSKAMNETAFTVLRL